MPALHTGVIIPATVTTWAAATVEALNSNVIPLASPNGLYFKATSVSGTGTTGGAEPTWPTIIGGTVTDNAGANQIIWTCQGAYLSGSGPIAVQVPVDADAPVSATVSTPADELTDWIAFVRSITGQLAVGNTWTAQQNFSPVSGNAIRATGNGGGFATILVFPAASGSAPGISSTGAAGGGAGVFGLGQGGGDGGDFTGSSAGAGVSGTGGASSGRGVFGTGGSPNGTGGYFQGTGTAPGALGFGGATNGSGFAGNGTGSGSGVQGFGGSTNGAGGSFSGGGAGTGVVALGGTSGGGGIGIIATGGTGSAPGGQFTGSGASAGLTAVSGGTGVGAQLTGNASSAALYLTPQAGLPSGPIEGYVSYNSTTHHLEYYNGSAWVVL